MAIAYTLITVRHRSILWQNVELLWKYLDEDSNFCTHAVLHQGLYPRLFIGTSWFQ